MRRSAILTAGLLWLLALFSAPAIAAAPQTPQQWVASFWPTAKAAGISSAVYNRALANFAPDPDVIKRANTQAEFTMAVWDYMDQMVSDDRISQGIATLAKYSDLLGRIEQRYGVDRYTVVAVWGIESHYGAALTNPRIVKNTISALATLAYAGGRLAKFGRQQLVAALRIAQRGDVPLAGMIGSWAGAMGQTQFIPTTFETYAVDFDGDGRRNIWTSNADALASTANYLRASGWQAGRTWGYEVAVPAAYDIAKTSGHPLGWWAGHGVVRVGGQAYPRQSDQATLFLPNGRNGPAFLLLANFRAIKRYNASNNYALAVGHLADRLRGGGPFVTPWPPHEGPLTDDEARQLQLALTMTGFYSGDIDGNLGSGTRDAIRDYQLQAGLKPDGVPSRDLLRRLAAEN